MAKALNPLPSLIRASAFDAANMRMVADGRKQWNDDDWNAMCATQDRLITACYGEGPRGCVRFSLAEGLEKAGYLTLGMKSADFFAAVDEYEAANRGWVNRQFGERGAFEYQCAEAA